MADANASFQQLREASLSPAQGGSVEGLGAFLERYIGECERAAEGMRECREHAKSFRSKAAGKKFYLSLGEDSLPPVRSAEGQGSETLLITPFFSADGYALTQGAPSRLDASGHPLMPYLTIRASSPEEGSLERLVRLRDLRLELVFTPQEVWSLPKRGGGRIYGVKARIHGVRVLRARGGETLALWLSR